MGPIFLRDALSYRYQDNSNDANGFDYAGRRQNRLRQLVGVVLLFTALIATACIPPPTSSGTSIGKDCKGVLNLVPGAELFGCDLSGLDLAGLDLSGANLKFANLTDANLSGSNLTGANLSGANLTRANLSGADLTNAILAGAILLGATFLYAILFNTSFNYGPVPGGSGSGSGSGGNNGGSTTCTGPYCAGYNEATVDTGDTLCSEDLGAQTGGEIEVYLSPEQLEQRGERSVVTDSDTSFRGAYFGFESDDESVNFFRGLSFEKADFTDATFSNFVIACRDITGARFSGVTFDDSGFNTLAHVTFRNSDFSRSTIRLLDMVEASFEGSKISDAAWSRVLAIVFEEIEAFNENVGLQMADFSNVDFRNSELGLASDPSNGSFLGIDVGGFRRGDNPPVLRYTTWANADLRGATITDLSAEGNIFTGVATDGLTVKGNGTVAGAIFDTGWLGVDWTGTYDFTGATCPDGSVGDTTNPCF